MAALRSDVASHLHPFDALLFSYAESADEWETLRKMAISDAGAWVAGKRVTPS